MADFDADLLSNLVLQIASEEEEEAANKKAEKKAAKKPTSSSSAARTPIRTAETEKLSKQLAQHTKMAMGWRTVCAQVEQFRLLHEAGRSAYKMASGRSRAKADADKTTDTKTDGGASGKRRQ